MTQTPVNIAVIDIGKTKIKVSAASGEGQVVESLSVANEVRPGPPWRHHDLKALTGWVAESVAALCRRHPIRHVVPVGHGSGGVLVGGDADDGGCGAALPMIDYEEACPPEIDADYRMQAGSFEDRGSAVMMASTHAARQLLRMQTEAPVAFAAARHFLNVAQYWGWWLSGVSVSEYSAMGAQSQLWNTPQRCWTPIVSRHGWERLLPGFRPAWASLGPIRATLARRHALPADLIVHTGAHDSSVNFYRYQAAGLTDFTLVSTGTWIVALSREAPVASLKEERGTTINSDFEGNTVGGALTMGGREFSHVVGPDWNGARADAATLARLVARETMALPSFGNDAGQFPGSAGRGRIVGPLPETQAERTALAVLYSALLTVRCAEELGPGARLILDGTFLQEPLFARVVAALRPGMTTELSRDTAGVAAGAALLAGHTARDRPAPLWLEPAPTDPRLPDLTEYAARWRAAADTQFRLARETP